MGLIGQAPVDGYHARGFALARDTTDDLYVSGLTACRICGVSYYKLNSLVARGKIRTRVDEDERVQYRRDDVERVAAERAAARTSHPVEAAG